MIDFQELYFDALQRRADAEFYAEGLEADHARLQENYEELRWRHSVLENEYRRLYAIVHRPNFAQQWLYRAKAQPKDSAPNDIN